jgi:hypothetical protein
LHGFRPGTSAPKRPGGGSGPAPWRARRS